MARAHFGRGLSEPELAICSSHVAVLSEFLQRSQANHILVLEDDVIFDTDFPLARFGAFCAENGIEYIRLFGKHYAKAIRLGFFYDPLDPAIRDHPGGRAGLSDVEEGRQGFPGQLSIDSTRPSTSRWTASGKSRYRSIRFSRIRSSSDFLRHRSRWRLMAGEFTLPERLSFNFKRIHHKLRKTWANAALRKTDRQLRQRAGRFRQIFGSDTEK